jgi:acid phosphatase type 7
VIRFFLLLCVAGLGFGEPVAVYLTLNEKPLEGMTICWLIPKEEQVRGLKLHKISDEQWQQKEVSSISLLPKIPYTLLTVELKDLEQNQMYEFVFEENSRPYRFKTLPSSLKKRPVCFVAGGDVYHDTIETLSTMNRLAALQNPDFALLGGDISYAASSFSFLAGDDMRWVDFLKCWSKTMRRGDGSLIPLVTAIGNHDVNGKWGQLEDKAALYYLLFPKGGYRVLDFGSYLSLWILDSGHTHPIEGEQTEWLKETLFARRPLYKFALYHVPAYPSVRDVHNKYSTQVRKFWVPLFEKGGIDVAFENHEHAYKRTYRIRDGIRSPDGVLYLGDGAWGVDKPRTPKTPDEAWYLAESQGIAHIHIVTLTEEGIYLEAMNREGKIFDRCKL